MASPHEIMARIDTIRTADFGRKLGKTALVNLLTEPVIRAMWAGQIVTDSDWIGIQALLAASYRLDPGGADNGSNLFVYTCKGGWIDMGHLVASALAYKAVYQGLKGNAIINTAMKLTLREAGSEFYGKVIKNISSIYKKVKKDKSGRPFSNSEHYQLVRESAELRVTNLLKLTGEKLSPREFKNKLDLEAKFAVDHLNKHFANGLDLEDLFYGYWAGYFGMQLGYAVEYDQNAAKTTEDQKQWTGHHTSAWTIEDLPSDYFGVLVGARLQRRMFVGSVIKQLKSEVNSMLADLNAVDLNNITEAPGCAETAREVLAADTKFYNHLADSQLVTNKKNDSVDPNSAYNYTVIPKKTKSHLCVCDENESPIHSGPPHVYYAAPEEVKPAKKRIRMGHPSRRLGR
ncbi:hypothetical protein GW916_15105 [bacterium]|nr:hypothetical protein [bacterium]